MFDYLELKGQPFEQITDQVALGRWFRVDFDGNLKGFLYVMDVPEWVDIDIPVEQRLEIYCNGSLLTGYSPSASGPWTDSLICSFLSYIEASNQAK